MCLLWNCIGMYISSKCHVVLQKQSQSTLSKTFKENQAKDQKRTYQFQFRDSVWSVDVYWVQLEIDHKTTIIVLPVESISQLRVNCDYIPIKCLPRLSIKHVHLIKDFLVNSSRYFYILSLQMIDNISLYVYGDGFVIPFIHKITETKKGNQWGWLEFLKRSAIGDIIRKDMSQIPPKISIT